MASAKSQADANFLVALRDQVGKHSIHAEDGKPQRQTAQQGSDPSCGAKRIDLTGPQGLHTMNLKHRSGIRRSQARVQDAAR